MACHNTLVKWTKKRRLVRFVKELRQKLTSPFAVTKGLKMNSCDKIVHLRLLFEKKFKSITLPRTEKSIFNEIPHQRIKKHSKIESGY